MKKIVSVILLLAAIAVIGTGVYLMNSSKYIFTRVVSKSINGLVDNVDNDDDILSPIGSVLDSAKSLMKTDTTVKSDIQDEKMDFNITGDIYQEISNNKFYFDVSSKMNKEAFIGIEAVLDSNKLYYKFDEIMDKFYYENIENENIDKEMTGQIGSLATIEEKDIKTLANHLKKAINSSVSNKDLTKAKEKISVNGKDINATRIAFKITDEKLYEIAIKLLKNIAKDNNAIKVLQKIDKEQTKESINKTIKELEKHLTDNKANMNEEIITYTVYLDNPFNVIRSKFSAGTTATISIDSYTNDGNVVDEYSVEAQNQEIATLKVTKKKDKSSDISANISGIAITGTHKRDAKASNISLDVSYAGTSLGTIEYKHSVIKKNTEHEIVFNVNLGMDLLGQISINSKNTITANKNMPNVDLSGSVETKDVEDKELLEVYEKLNTILEKFGLDSLLGNSDDKLDKEEDYDDIVVPGDI